MFFVELIVSAFLLCISLLIVFQIIIPFVRGTKLFPMFQNNHELNEAIRDLEQQNASKILNEIKNDSK